MPRIAPKIILVEFHNVVDKKKVSPELIGE
jgi:hypothetical protein